MSKNKEEETKKEVRVVGGIEGIEGIVSPEKEFEYLIKINKLLDESNYLTVRGVFSPDPKSK